ncbi:sensor histidine kinase [Polymorphobacter fuscus]|uniref:sensor histidine kinase n=1 Tax=Sandarakinorhabdus fusca TaxID=1439888 RepID=UPI001A9CABCB|nr:sensor histidine kinase [Polymorphobacter fuscus]
MPEDEIALDHVLVMAPYRRDAEFLQKLFAENEIDVEVCADAGNIVECLADSPGVLVLTHEALTPSVIAYVASHLVSQPAWFEMPIVVLLHRTSDDARLKAELASAWPQARHLYYQRPVTPVELISGVQSAMLSRIRQRDVRDHIALEVELRRELNHRVKNILASVTSILELTYRSADNLSEFANDLRGRLMALSNVHSAVFEAADEAVSFEQIVNLTFEPYRIAGQGRISVGGPVVMLSRGAGTTLALCLHELATNAIKYGGLSTGAGTVSFTWSLSGTDPVELAAVWQEAGGPAVTVPSRAGYGTRYLKSALASLFGAKPVLTYDASGLRCEVTGRVSRLAWNA